MVGCFGVWWLLVCEMKEDVCERGLGGGAGAVGERALARLPERDDAALRGDDEAARL